MTSRPDFAGSRAAIALAVLFTAAGIVVGLSSAQALSASRSSRLSEDARLVGRAGQALDAALAATTADPNRAEYWHQLGFAYVSGGRWRDAAASFDRAVRLAPWDLRNIGDLVQTQILLARDGDAAARVRAEQLVNEAVRRDPNYPDAQYTRAVVMQFIGDAPEALSSIERALTLSPRTTNAQWYVVALQLYVAAGRAEDGIRAAREGLFMVDSPQIRIELARALLVAGRAQEALVEVDRVLAAEPGNTAAQRLRFEILAAIPR
jgi:Tfp pilus assembly protein PilF